MIRALVLLMFCTVPAHATRAETLPAPPNLPGGPVQKFFAAQVTVDGLPTYREEWRVWDGIGKTWVPMASARGMQILFGMQAIEDVDWHPILPAPPIPKRQRRME